jgi:hypothetical protein
VSIYSLRVGTQRIFKCPNCKELHKFNVTHFGTDPMLPTHGDNSETGIGGGVWAVLLIPFVALLALGFFLLFTVKSPNVLLLIIPVTLAVAWILIYTLYLYLKVSREDSRKLQEAM